MSCVRMGWTLFWGVLIIEFADRQFISLERPSAGERPRR